MSVAAAGAAGAVNPTAASSAGKLIAFSAASACGVLDDDDDDVSGLEHPLPGPELGAGVAVAGPALVTALCFVLAPLLGLLVLSRPALRGCGTSTLRAYGGVAAMLLGYFTPAVASAAAALLTHPAATTTAMTLGAALMLLCGAVLAVGVRASSIGG